MQMFAYKLKKNIVFTCHVPWLLLALGKKKIVMII